MPTDKQLEALNLYAALMEEAKARLYAIETGLGTARALLPTQLTTEFCFLQFRMICELIALGCLVAHGDVTADGKGKRLLNEWNADKIMKDLELLHPHFFPRPIKITVVPPREAGRPANLQFEEKKGGYLTKSGLLDLYGRSGDALHRGTVNKLLGRKRAPSVSDLDIMVWRNKITELLNDHRIASWDNLRHFICAFQDSTRGGRVNVAFAEAPPGTSVEYAQSLFAKNP